MKIETAVATDPGRERPRNEDRVCSHRLLAPQLWLLAVADGMGGHDRGDVASTVAMETVERRVGELEAPPPDPLEFLELAVHEANRNVFSAGRETGVDMGTTLTVALVAEPLLFIAHVGDSRAYCATRRRMDQLTEDHSWEAEQRREHGEEKASEFENGAYAGLITRYVGVASPPKVALYKRALVRDATYVFCTDGLHSCVSDAAIHRQARRNGGLDRACRQLIQLANRSGGHDNISVGLLRAS
jgi:PPM family protein phosphatase